MKEKTEQNLKLLYETFPLMRFQGIYNFLINPKFRSDS
jgi:hypothetical protein